MAILPVMVPISPIVRLDVISRRRRGNVVMEAVIRRVIPFHHAIFVPVAKTVEAVPVSGFRLLVRGNRGVTAGENQYG